MDLLGSILLFGHLNGSILTVSTGILLAIGHSLGQAHTDLNHLKIAVKLVIALCILILARLGLNKQPMPNLLTAVGLLGLINTAFASIW